MRTPRTRSLPLFILMLIAGSARADYVMPPFSAVVSEATSIVDATTVEHAEKYRVGLKVHQVLKGDRPPPSIAGAHLTCLGVDISRMLQPDRRYIFLLYKTGLYEETSFYETEERAGVLFCKCWDGSAGFRRRWMPVSEFKKLIDGAESTP